MNRAVRAAARVASSATSAARGAPHRLLSSAGGAKKVVCGTRTHLPQQVDIKHNPRVAADIISKEFENSSSSEEVVAAERGEDVLGLENSSSTNAPDGDVLMGSTCDASGEFTSAPTSAARKVSHQMGRDSKHVEGSTRPAGGLENPTEERP
jgi:hypothetical protein